MKGRNNGTQVVLRKIETTGRRHHGGAWKVAYADFVTAMMAFFLMMWLLNATTEEQRRGLADFFAPANPLGRSTSGFGAPFGGRTPHDSEPLLQDAGAIRLLRGPLVVLPDVETEDESEVLARAVPRRDGPEGEDEEAELRRVRTARADAPPGDQEPRLAMGRLGPARPGDAALRAEQARREREALERAAEEIRGIVANDPVLAGLSDQLLIEQTPEGLRIQLLDAERQPMFALGSSMPNDRARLLVTRISQVAARLPNPISIAGHTDATPFRTGTERSNWDLSAERANALRRLLVESGLPETRIRSVTGHAAREPLLPEQPAAAANRRVTITLLRQVPGETAR